MSNRMSWILLAGLVFAPAPPGVKAEQPLRRLPLGVFQDKMKGGWLGQMNLGKEWKEEDTEYQRPYIPRYGREPKRGTAGVFINAEAETSLKGLFAGGDQTCGSVDASGAGVYSGLSRKLLVSML